MFYFIDILFKRKIVSKLTQVSNKIFKMRYFSFTFKFTKKKKVPLKIWLGEGFTRKFLLKKNFSNIDTLS